MYDFSGQTALVTGAAGNLGWSVAQAFADQGARLILVDLHADRLNNLVGHLAGDGHRAVPCNLIDPDMVKEMAAMLSAEDVSVDILANVAGGFTMGPLLHETVDKDWNFMFDLNARSVFHMCRAFIPGMLDQGGGKIINVSARAAVTGKGQMAPYCASKAAVLTLTESLAAEHKFNNINVNCILPGTIDTPQNREAMPTADHSTWVPPAALADVVTFLASETARCVTGAAIPVYGKS